MVRLVWFPGYMDWERRKYTWEIRGQNADVRGARSFAQCVSLVYIYGTCVFRIYVHPAPFVRDAIFPHCMLVHVTTVAQDTRLAGQKG